MRNRRNRLGIVWVSTVIYTLIGLAVIGMLLAVVRPRIAELRDRFTIEQTLESLNAFDGLVEESKIATGARRRYELKLDKGEFFLDADNDVVGWRLIDSHYQYSEVNKTVKIGRIDVLTTGEKPVFSVTLSVNYSRENINITVDGKDVPRTLTPAPSPYVIFVENKGPQIEWRRLQIDVTVE